ncbi:hypothetical protein BGW80DRAFT_614661 [Lactifluus volemus]|nr:hypothetical protein BGW80DRAFT_614661 [Lactifluus volemus]
MVACQCPGSDESWTNKSSHLGCLEGLSRNAKLLHPKDFNVSSSGSESHACPRSHRPAFFSPLSLGCFSGLVVLAARMSSRYTYFFNKLVFDIPQTIWFFGRPEYAVIYCPFAPAWNPSSSATGQLQTLTLIPRAVHRSCNKVQLFIAARQHCGRPIAASRHKS